MKQTKKNRLNSPERFEWIPPLDICELLNIKEGMRLLDTGAGTGYFAKMLIDTIPNLTIECLDTDPAMVEEIRSITPASGSIRAQLTDGNHYPLEDSSIDAAYSIALFHELKDYKSFASEHKRVLKTGAPLLIIDWEKILESTTRGPSLEYRIDTEDVTDVLEKAGFQNISIHRNFVYRFAVRCENI